MPYTLACKFGLIFQCWESRVAAIWMTMVKTIRLQGRRASAATCFLLASVAWTCVVRTPVFSG
jgi:hypothetical protein